MRELQIPLLEQTEEEIKKQTKKTRSLEKNRIWCRAYYRKNIEKMRARGRVARTKDPEKFRRRERARYARNQPKIRASATAYYYRNREKILIKKNADYEKNAPQIKEQAREYRIRARRLAMNAYGGAICRCCGEDTLEFLAVDHINGGGNQHRKKNNAIGTMFYVWLRKNKYPSGFQVLCHSCNQAKGFYGTCPHTQMKTPIDLYLESLK